MEFLNNKEKKDIRDSLQRYMNLTPSTGKRERRKLAIEDMKQLIGWVDTPKSALWKFFQFPMVIPTEWIEGWQQTLIIYSMDKNKRQSKLFDLLNETRQ